LLLKVQRFLAAMRGRKIFKKIFQNLLTNAKRCSIVYLAVESAAFFGGNAGAKIFQKNFSKPIDKCKTMMYTKFCC